MDLLGNLNTQQLILATATAIGAFGGFPDPPSAFKQLTKNELFQWALVFVLVYQGGSGQNIQLALLITGAMYAVTRLLKANE